MNTEYQEKGMSERDIDLAHHIVDLMTSTDVLAPQDIAAGTAECEEDAVRVLSYVSRWARQSLGTRAGRPSRLRRHYFPSVTE